MLISTNIRVWLLFPSIKSITIEKMGAINQKQTRGRTFSLGYERDKNGKAGYYMPFASDFTFIMSV
jgi:hypothetical protein